MQLTTTGYNVCIWGVCWPQRAEKTSVSISSIRRSRSFRGSYVLTFFDRENGRVVDQECHLQCWFIDVQGAGNASWLLDVGDRFTDVQLHQDREMAIKVACFCLFRFQNACKTLETEHLDDAAFFHFAVALQDRYLLVQGDTTAVNTTDTDTTEIVAVVEHVDLNLQRLIWINIRRWMCLTIASNGGFMSSPGVL